MATRARVDSRQANILQIFIKTLQTEVLVQMTWHWERLESGFVHFIGKFILKSRRCKTTQHSLHSSLS